MLSRSQYQNGSTTTNAEPSQNAVGRNQGQTLEPHMKDYSDTDDDADYGEDEEENDDDDDDEPQAPVRASGSTSRSQVKVPLTSMPPRGNVGRTHAYKDRKHQKVLEHFKKIKTEPDTYYLQSKNPCQSCLGNWPCIMKRTAPKFRSCGGSRCSFYPKAGEMEPDSSNSKASRATPPSSSIPSWSKRQRPDLSAIDPSPVRPQQQTKKSRNEVATARKDVVIIIDDEESGEETTFHKTELTNFSSTSPTSSRPTSFKRQLPDLSDHASGPDESRNKSQKSRNEEAPARKEVVFDVDDGESDEEKYEHNSQTCRNIIRKLEAQGWYTKLKGKGKGHCLRDLLGMEKLHWRSVKGSGRGQFEEVV